MYFNTYQHFEFHYTSYKLDTKFRFLFVKKKIIKKIKESVLQTKKKQKRKTKKKRTREEQKRHRGHIAHLRKNSHNCDQR